MTAPKKTKEPSLIASSLSSIVNEIASWKHLIKTEWPLLLVMFGGIALLIFISEPLPPRNVYMAAGEPGSSFEQLGKKFQPFFEKEGITLHLVNTEGLTDGLRQVNDAQSKITAGLVIAGINPKSLYPGVESLGSIEYVPLWLFYRGKRLSHNELLDTARGQAIAIGEAGSSSALLASRVLSLAGIETSKAPNFLHLSDAEATQKILDGEIFAMFIADGENGPNMQRLLKERNLNIYDFEYAQAIAKKITFLNSVQLPKGMLDLENPYPPTDVNMLATTAMLLIDKNMHPAIQLIFLKGAEQISRNLEPFFTNPSFFPSYQDHSFPLSPIANLFYEKGPPPLSEKLPTWLVSYIDKIWLLLVAAFAVFYPLLKLFPNYQHSRASLLISQDYTEILNLEREARATDDIHRLREMVVRLEEINIKALLIDMPTDDINRLYSMKGTLNNVTQLILKKIDALELKRPPGEKP